jgi:hypothetical protein
MTPFFEHRLYAETREMGMEDVPIYTQQFSYIMQIMNGSVKQALDE